MHETILFVDDDVGLLKGLQRMLRSKRNEWDMTFVASGEEALMLMHAQCYGVVVADMRMPGIGGAELLEKTRELCPRSVRMILSGQAELASILESVRSTHIYLAKPCQPEALMTAIERAVRLRKMMLNEKLENFISQLQVIPSQPELYAALLAELDSASPSLERLGGIVTRDIGMAIKVLQLVNSSFFGAGREVTDVREAVRMLGSDLLKTLCATGAVFSSAGGGSVGALRLDQLNCHSVSVGNFAQRVAKFEGMPRPASELCATLGLLHDVGKLVLSMYAPEAYAPLASLGEESPERIEREIAMFGSTHAEIGAYLLGLWGLPTSLVEAASSHRDGGALDLQCRSPLAALKVASALAGITENGFSEKLEGFLEVSAAVKSACH